MLTNMEVDTIYYVHKIPFELSKSPINPITKHKYTDDKYVHKNIFHKYILLSDRIN